LRGRGSPLVSVAGNFLLAPARKRKRPPLSAFDRAPWRQTTVSDITQHAAKRIEIHPAITASIEIKTGSNTVWKYLTKPITNTFTERG
jgi:hypothetical protein